MKIKILFTSIIVSLFFVSPVVAAIGVAPLMVYMQPGKSKYKDVLVHNISATDNAYVLITPEKILNIGAKDEKKVFSKNPKEFGLLVSPRKAVIKAKGSKRVRFFTTNINPDKETYYSVNIVPVRNAGAEDKETKGVVPRIILNVGYAVRVFVLPRIIKPKISIMRNNKQLTFNNQGNVSFVYYKIKQCDVTGKSCEQYPSRRIYPGNISKLDLKYKTPVMMEQENYKQEFKSISTN